MAYETTRDALRAGAAARVRVGVDTSPLVQTRAGTARHVRGLARRVARPPRDRPRAPVVRRAGTCLERRPGRALVPARPAAARPALDVLHCTTFRGPVGYAVSRRCSRCTTSPSCARPKRSRAGTACTAAPGSTRVLRAADAIVAVSEFTRGETIDARGRGTGARSASCPTASTTCSRPDGPRADGDYVLAVATLEPRKNLGSRCRSGTRGRRRAARRRRARLGRRRRRGLGRRGARRRARGALSRRAVRRLPVAVRGLRSARARGDGVRNACRDVASAPRWRRSRARLPSSSTRSTSPRSRRGSAEAIARRDELVPARPRARAVHSRGSARPTPSSPSGGSSREGRRLRRGRARPAAHGRRDVRAQPPARARRRSRGRRASGSSRSRAAPGPRPRRRRAVRAALRARRSSAWPGRCRARSAGSAPRSVTRSTRCRCARPARASSPSTTCRSRASPSLMGVEGPSSSSAVVVPRAVRERRARAHRVRAHEARSRRALRRAARARSSSRRTASTPPSRPVRARTTTSSRSERSRRGRTSSRRSTRPRRSGCRSSSSARRRTPRSPPSSAARGARLEGYVDDDAARASCTAAQRASCSRAATRASACPCSRRWRRARRSSPSPIRPLREVAGDAAVCSRTAVSSRAGSAPRSPSASALVAAGLERARAFSWRATAERTLAVYREVLGA